MNPATGPESEPCCAASTEAPARTRPNIRKSRVVMLFSMWRAHRSGACRDGGCGIGGRATAASVRGPVNAAGHRGAGDSQNRDQLAGAGRGRGSGAGEVIGLRDDGGKGRAAVRSRDMDLVLALGGIGLQSASYGAALCIGGHRKGVRATGEFPAGSAGGQLEEDEGAGHRPVVFVLHLDDGLTRGALADVVDGAVAFHNHEVELGNRGLSRRAWRKRQGDQSGEKPRQVTHRNPPRSYYGW